MLGFYGLYSVIELLIGIGLIINCIRGLASQQWVYDRESAKMMNFSQLLGIVIGCALVAHSVGLFYIPFPFYWGRGLLF